MPDPSPPHLTVQLRHRIGVLQIDLAFELTQPWTILFGPSGSGKTTILRAIAGLVRPDYARVFSPGTHRRRAFTLVDTEARVSLPTHRRAIRLASQQPRLFPHMTVRENLNYSGNSSAADPERNQLIAKLLADFHLSHLAEKYPVKLSGGEAQRATLARTVAGAGCRLAMLDEPFTGLDLDLRDELVANFLRWQGVHGIPILSVTHDIAEAFRINAEVIKLYEGRIVAQGPAAQVLAEERTRLIQQLSQPAETPASPAPAPA